MKKSYIIGKKNPPIKWTILTADVYVGRFKSFTKKDALHGKIDNNSLIHQGFDSIIGYSMESVKEIVCFKESNIFIIKYIHILKCYQRYQFLQLIFLYFFSSSSF